MQRTQIMVTVSKLAVNNITDLVSLATLMLALLGITRPRWSRRWVLLGATVGHVIVPGAIATSFTFKNKYTVITKMHYKSTLRGQHVWIEHLHNYKHNFYTLRIHIIKTGAKPWIMDSAFFYIFLFLFHMMIVISYCSAVWHKVRFYRVSVMLPMYYQRLILWLSRDI